MEVGSLMSLIDQFGDLDVFWSVDHSQLEIRVLAQFAKDKRLIALIKSGEDIHSAVGQELTGLPIAKLKKDRAIRTAIKGIHFGIIYGLAPENLYYKLKVDATERGEDFTMEKEEVVRMYNKYFQRFSGVRTWLDGQYEYAENYGHVDTLFGFRREVSIFGEEGRDTFWKNQAVNSPIQGTAHQLLMIALAILEKKKKTYKLLQRLSMEIHDSLVGFGKVKHLLEIYKLAMQLLEKDVLEYIKEAWPEVEWEVPLKAEAKAGFRLGILVEYAGEPVEEFIEKWCEANHKFETDLRKQMQDG